MLRLLLTGYSFLLMMGFSAGAQDKLDSTIVNLQNIPIKYITGVDKKITQYSSRITAKTENTLAKLSRWENKIQSLLQKVNPEAANRLFGNNQLTFTILLQKMKQGEALALSYKAQYSKYEDNVTTSLNYISQQKDFLDTVLIKKVKETSSKMKELAQEEDKSEAFQQFIKERKKQLIAGAFQHIGKSKYLTKINKEAYYYAETLKNYKELFSNGTKSEETVKNILQRIPAFQKFMQQNSQLAALFGQSNGGLNSGTSVSMAGLQTRAAVQSLIQDRITSGGPNAIQQVQQNIQTAQEELFKIKDKLLNSSIGNGEGEIPDFKPNQQKTKTFAQRMEYGFNMQFGKANNLLPSGSDIALSVGYKINDKSVIGAAASYKLGFGSIQHIRFTHEGIGLRSFMDWKLKKKFFVSGGYEMNYFAQFNNSIQLKNYDAWQRSALIGITKKINIKTKWFKTTKVQLLYDFLSKQHLPVGQPVVFRVGYGF